MRYIVALLIAGAIIVAGYLLVSTTFGEIEANVEQRRQQLKEQKANGTLPDEWKDVDLDKIKWSDFGMQLSSNMHIRLDLSMWLRDFWFVAAPFTVIVCLAGAYLWGRAFRRGTK